MTTIGVKPAVTTVAAGMIARVMIAPVIIAPVIIGWGRATGLSAAAVAVRISVGATSADLSLADGMPAGRTSADALLKAVVPKVDLRQEVLVGMTGEIGAAMTVAPVNSGGDRVASDPDRADLEAGRRPAMAPGPATMLPRWKGALDRLAVQAASSARQDRAAPRILPRMPVDLRRTNWHS